MTSHDSNSEKGAAHEEHGHGGLMAAAGIVAVAAGAIGAYLYGTKDGAKKRKQIKSWMIKAKAEILEEIENVKEVTEEKYHDIVDSVMAKYKVLSHVDASDFKDLVDDLKAHWVDLKAEMDHEKKASKASHK